MADNGVITLVERATDPSAPADNRVNIYLKSDGVYLQKEDGSAEVLVSINASAVKIYKNTNFS